MGQEPTVALISWEQEAITLGPLLGNTLYVMFVESDLGVNIGRQPAYIVHSSSSLKTRLPHCSSKHSRPFHLHQKDRQSGRVLQTFRGMEKVCNCNCRYVMGLLLITDVTQCDDLEVGGMRRASFPQKDLT